MKTGNTQRTSSWTIVLFISLIILVVMGLVSNALEIGERLGKVHIAIEILFYILIAVVVLGGIVYPLVGVFFAPVFSLEKLHNADGSARRKWCKRLVDNLLENVELTPEEQEEIKGYLSLQDETDDKLIEFFDRKITPELNREIFDTARKIFIITAVSQNSTYDMLGMASANFSLIKRIVEICGFRPSNAQVFRIYIRVLSMTLLAGSLEDMDIEELIPMVTEGGIRKGSWYCCRFCRAGYSECPYNASHGCHNKELPAERRCFAYTERASKKIICRSYDHP